MRHYDPNRRPPDPPPWFYVLYERLKARSGAANGDGGAHRANHYEDSGVISEGTRNSRLTSLGGAMRHKGFTEAAIRAALRAENEARCQPPLDDEEVDAIARSVSRYEPDPFAGVRIVGGRKKGKEEEALATDFPEPIPASALQKGSLAGEWLWHGMMARGSITLFSALWKAGKTTLLGHLLAAVDGGGLFCDLEVKPAKVLYITEESEAKWADRRDQLVLADHVHFLVRPLACRPDAARWADFLGFLDDKVAQYGYDAVIFDPISHFWPLRDENDAVQVQDALLPLHQLSPNIAVMGVHHARKSDGLEATASRGSGALSAFVDIILELRRYNPVDKKDRRRVLAGYGRYDETPAELVVELLEQGGYVAKGDRDQEGRHDIMPIIFAMLPAEPPGMSYAEVIEAWPEEHVPRKKRMLESLHAGVEQKLWHRDGEGVRGSPWLFWRGHK